MDGKDKRKMNTIEKRRNSLAGKAVRGSLRSCLLLGTIALLLGLGIFGNTLVQRSISRASETAAKASVSAERGADSVGFAKEIMDVYRSLTPEERAKTGTEEYKAHFSGLESVSRKGGPRDTLVHMLRNFVIDVDYV